MRRQYPLRLHIVVLLGLAILSVAAALGWMGYRHISQLILTDTTQLFRAIPRDMEQAFALRYRPVSAAIAVLASSDIATAKTLEQRLTQLDVLAEVLQLETHVSGFQVGYANGDYFILRPLRNERTRSLFEAPAGAAYVVDHIADEAGQKVQQRRFLDKSLQAIGGVIATGSSYDPRRRPWYTAAREGAGDNQVTPAYRFFFLQQYGVTFSRLSARGDSVLAIDITLESLSETLASNPVSESAFSVLVNSDGEVLAETGLGLSSTEDGIITLGDVRHPLLEAFLRAPQQDGIMRFSFEGADWLGARQSTRITAGNALDLLVAAPERELFASALELRDTSLWVTLAILLLAIPVAWIAAGLLARPLRELAGSASAISNMDFSHTGGAPSPIQEVDELRVSMESMKSTVSNFMRLINSLSGDPDIDHLLQTVTAETRVASGAQAAIAYLVDNDSEQLTPCAVSIAGTADGMRANLQPMPLDLSDASAPFVQEYRRGESGLLVATADDQRHPALAALCHYFAVEHLNVVMLPLRDRQQDSRGVLFLVFTDEASLSPERMGFSQALSGFAAVSMESGQLLQMQKRLLQAFIELIAGAIDAKSPYTGGHCQRVPELTLMLARAACESEDGSFADFDLDEDEWEALRIAAWLHDCGKVTTPEYVVDKSTKLETLYDRIHEVRMRFEVLKRDAEISYWRQLAEGEDAARLAELLAAEHRQLDEDFAFIAECNLGGEFMSDEAIERLERIGARVWRRTLDDRLGISWEEQQRKQREPAPTLPTEETLLADRVSHIIERPAAEVIAADNPWDFKLEVPEHKYNRGELYNLAVRRGTLSEEERYTINGHMVQTIMMLDQLPFTGHLGSVPEIAGGHHEKMDGTGYPKRLSREQMSLPARMMAIADIFEALTASDRPYKQAKSLQESLAIMERMVEDQHIDGELFRLFVDSGIYREYAERFLGSV